MVWAVLRELHVVRAKNVIVEFVVNISRRVSLFGDTSQISLYGDNFYE